MLSPRSSPEPGATDLEGNYLGPTSGISFLNRVWRRLRLRQDDVSTIPSPSCLPQEEACKNKSSGSSSSSVFRFGDRPLSEDYTETGFTLPPLEKALQLVGIYFDFSIVTYRFLHRGAVESWVREMYEKNISPANPPTGNLVARAAIVFMVFAVATMHGERRPGDSDSEECNERSDLSFLCCLLLELIEIQRTMVHRFKVHVFHRDRAAETGDDPSTPWPVSVSTVLFTGKRVLVRLRHRLTTRNGARAASQTACHGNDAAQSPVRLPRA